MLFANSKNSFAKDPAVVLYKEKYTPRYTARYDDTSLGIGVCESDDMESFCGKKGEWNSSEAGHPQPFVDADGKPIRSHD